MKPLHRRKNFQMLRSRGLRLPPFEKNAKSRCQELIGTREVVRRERELLAVRRDEGLKVVASGLGDAKHGAELAFTFRPRPCHPNGSPAAPVRASPTSAGPG